MDRTACHFVYLIPGAQVLVLPHLDPGFVSYGPADPRILRLMLLTWIRTFILIDCCYEELVDPQTPAQRDLCMHNRSHQSSL